MAKKESRPAWFKLFRHQKALIDSVPDESAGKAIKAVFQYFENGEVPTLSPLEFAVFSSIKPYVDESFEDFAETSRKNRENVQKRWGKERCSSGNQSLPVVPVVTSCTSGNQSLPLDTKNTEAEAEKIPLRDFPLSTEITHNRDAALVGGHPPRFYFDEKLGRAVDRGRAVDE